MHVCRLYYNAPSFTLVLLSTTLADRPFWVGHKTFRVAKKIDRSLRAVTKIDRLFGVGQKIDRPLASGQKIDRAFGVGQKS